jgi:hypothetical protein
MTAGRTNSNQLSQHWGTPEKYVSLIRVFFEGQIDLDPCSNGFSIVKATREYLLPDNDGLIESWNYRNIFVNPPYGSDKQRGTRISDWLCRCQLANYKYNSQVVALVPVAVNTGHWKKYVWGKASAVCFLADTRLKFSVNGKDDGKGAPMACCLVYWGNNVDRFKDYFQVCGAALDIRQLIKMRDSSDISINQETIF